MNPQMIVKERMPAGRAAWIDTALYQARNIRSANCIIVNEPMLMISGQATFKHSHQPPGSFFLTRQIHRWHTLEALRGAVEPMLLIYGSIISFQIVK